MEVLMRSYCERLNAQVDCTYTDKYLQVSKKKMQKQMQSPTPHVPHYVTAGVKTPDTAMQSRIRTNAVSVATKKSGVKQQCIYCTGETCHNHKYGAYLYSLCMGILEADVAAGIKTEEGMLDSMFRQRYHVFAELERFNEGVR